MEFLVAACGILGLFLIGVSPMYAINIPVIFLVLYMWITH